MYSSLYQFIWWLWAKGLNFRLGYLISAIIGTPTGTVPALYGFQTLIKCHCGLGWTRMFDSKEWAPSCTRFKCLAGAKGDPHWPDCDYFQSIRWQSKIIAPKNVHLTLNDKNFSCKKWNDLISFQNFYYEYLSGPFGTFVLDFVTAVFLFVFTSCGKLPPFVQIYAIYISLYIVSLFITYSFNAHAITSL